MSLRELLPLVNACLNASSGILLAAGLLAIKRGKRELHRRFMLGAFAASALFLCSYLSRVFLFGTTRFPVEGGWKSLYLAVLGSHTVLAMALLPMALRTLWLSWNGRYAPHKRIARITFPVWIYVSTTGVVVYLMLYHLPSLIR
jgi:putative membrane protein